MITGINLCSGEGSGESQGQKEQNSSQNYFKLDLYLFAKKSK